MDNSAAELGLQALIDTGFFERIPVDIFALAKRLGVDVEFVRPERLVQLAKDSGQSLSVKDVRNRFMACIMGRPSPGNPPVAFLSFELKRHKEKLRIALAHELGHHLAREAEKAGGQASPILEPRFKTANHRYVRFEQKRQERFADQVGRALLMNPLVFARDIRNYNIFQLAQKYQVPLHDVVDNIISTNVCGMARLFGWYGGPSGRVHGLDSYLSPAPGVELSQGVYALSEKVREIDPTIQEWLRNENRLDEGYFSAGTRRLGIAVYNHHRSRRLILLMSDVEDISRHQLQFGIFRQLKALR